MSNENPIVGSNSKKSSSAKVIIHVSDENDNSPKVIFSSYSSFRCRTPTDQYNVQDEHNCVQIEENDRESKFIGKVIVSDQDALTANGQTQFRCTLNENSLNGGSHIELVQQIKTTNIMKEV